MEQQTTPFLEESHGPTKKSLNGKPFRVVIPRGAPAEFTYMGTRLRIEHEVGSIYKIYHMGLENPACSTPGLNDGALDSKTRLERGLKPCFIVNVSTDPVFVLSNNRPVLQLFKDDQYELRVNSHFARIVNTVRTYDMKVFANSPYVAPIATDKYTLVELKESGRMIMIRARPDGTLLIRPMTPTHPQDGIHVHWTDGKAVSVWSMEGHSFPMMEMAAYDKGYEFFRIVKTESTVVLCGTETMYVRPPVHQN